MPHMQNRSLPISNVATHEQAVRGCGYMPQRGCQHHTSELLLERYSRSCIGLVANGHNTVPARCSPHCRKEVVRMEEQEVKRRGEAVGQIISGQR